MSDLINHNIKNKYKVVSLIGKGNFSEVLQCINLNTNAVRCFNSSSKNLNDLLLLKCSQSPMGIILLLRNVSLIKKVLPVL